MRSRSVLAVVATLGALSGCILFVNDDQPYGKTCKFQGSDTACGECITTACASELDACCGDKSCESQLTWLDECVSDSDAISCQVLASSAPSLVTCLEQRCGACPGSDGGAGSGSGGGGTASPSCSTYTGYCICVADGSSGGGTCSPETVSPGLCCAGSGYPADGTSCTCETFSCTVTSDGADCSLGETPTGTSSYSGNVCCSTGSGCYCSDSLDSCDDDETQVDECTVDAVGCPSGTDVTSCSF
ncbi:MAG TPA: hypothetical protein VGL81_30950 [Polyangiaceae bacterium]|jgi:hypothetical protein